MSRNDIEYDRLHRRCTNQRRELRRLNRKIKNLEMHLIVAARDGHTWLSQQKWAFEIHHRNNELKRKLDEMKRPKPKPQETGWENSTMAPGNTETREHGGGTRG